MKILIISIGKKHDIALAPMIADYQERCKTSAKIEWFVAASSDKPRESEKIMATIKQDDYVVLLDERGKMITHAGAVKVFEQSQQHARRLVFVIGGAYGVDQRVTQRADSVWALSGLIMPHQIVRLVLIEQVYRTLMIMRDHPYHHSD